ncbi:uncharacterized protein IL334_006297 [Kwoniella shivajii]|uniref:Zn(2)-C6 fungal-type domain-containing protein n=1 Tax=Kwoniella shivajii TaxID=564305 RepID=A0ABZ1D681_9TREE|nr:hypothetical protein IL334_006297 [Kwoniella shivajii]
MSSAGGPSAVAKPIKRACDQCHARKVKCSGQEPCETCQRSDLTCSFLKPVLPKGPAPRSMSYRARKGIVPGNGARISRSSSPVRRPREDSVQSWKSDAWRDFDTTFQPAQWNFSSLQPEETASASAVLEGLWEEICAESSGESTNTVVDEIRTTSPTSSFSTQPGLLDTFDPFLLTTPPPPIPTNSNPTSTFDDTNLFSLLSQALVPNTNIAQPNFYNNFSVLGSTFTPSTSIPWSLPFCPPEDVSPILTLTLETLIKPQLEVFFERVYPMIPIFPRSFVFGRLEDVEYHQNRAFVALILAMVSLSLIHPLKPEEVRSRPTRAKQSQTLMDEVYRLRSKMDWASQTSVEGATTSFVMFGALFELGHAEGSRLRLREALGIGELLKLDEARTYMNVEPDEARRRMRLFWVLGITERAFALQRYGAITFHGSLQIPAFMALDPTQDLASRTLHHLARLFSFVDSNLVTCWNGKCDPTTCTDLPRAKVLRILRTLNGTPSQVFGSDIALTGLSDVQQADLLITWQWLRNRVWRLAVGHGLTDENAEAELGVGYVVDVASATVLICRRLSAGALEAHGCGFVEKLYDIASIVTELMQSSPQLQSKLMDVARTDQWNDLLQSLYNLVAQHSSGTTFIQPMSQALSIANGVRMLCASTG